MQSARSRASDRLMGDLRGGVPSMLGPVAAAAAPGIQVSRTATVTSTETRKGPDAPNPGRSSLHWRAPRQERRGLDEEG